MSTKNKSLGICVGASTITIVELEKYNFNNCEVKRLISKPHNGTPKQVLLDELRNFNLKEYNTAVTGRKFKNLVNCTSLPEPEAIEYTLRFLELNGKYDTIASLGGENFIIYSLDKRGKIKTVYTGNKCASGTGEFFLQQIGRMNLPIEEALESHSTKNPYSLSGRCSVFCKSDCTHALNKGIPKENVVSGLSNMIANKIFELLAKQKPENILLIGGVPSIKSIVDFIRVKYPDAVIPKEASYFEALGTGVYAFENGSELDVQNLSVMLLTDLIF
jgi:CoA-substrate-specific enzyme activase, putative